MKCQRCNGRGVIRYGLGRLYEKGWRRRWKQRKNRTLIYTVAPCPACWVAPSGRVQVTPQ